MSAVPGLKMGPLDPDTTQDFGKVAGKTSARELVRHHQRAHPAELTKHLIRPQDVERSKALDMDEVKKASRRAEVPGEVVGANVRGERDREQIVCVTFRVASGRTGKAVLPYTDRLLPDSVASGDEAVRIADAQRRDQPWLPQEVLDRLAGGGDADTSARLAELEKLVREQGGADTKVLLERIEELERQVEEPTRIEATVTQEPFEGYADANVGVVKDRIAEEPEGFEREYLKRRIREAEEARDEPRRGVLDATEPVELVPADVDQGD